MASSNNEVLKWPVSALKRKLCRWNSYGETLFGFGIKIVTTIKQKDIVIFLLQKILTAKDIKIRNSTNKDRVLPQLNGMRYKFLIKLG